MAHVSTNERPLRLVVIGGVAAGATAAARARRIDERAEITVIERGPYVSFANCGLPYFISGDISRRSQLLLQTPEGFAARYGVQVRLGAEAVELDRAGKRVRIRGPEGEEWLPYDRLILAQGGLPIMPPVPGSDAPHVFRLWTVPDMDRIHDWIEREQPRSAVVVGGGFIGIEMAEALRRRGLETTMVERLPTVMAAMDPELGHMIADHLASQGVRVVTGASVTGIDRSAQQVELSTGERVAAGLVLFAAGVKPELQLVQQAGLAIGEAGGLLVDQQLRTSDPSIFAAGDMVEVVHRVSGRRVRVPLAGPANRQGRIAASNALGLQMSYGGALGSSVVKVFDATAAMTGLGEAAARQAGFDAAAAVVYKDHHAGYYPGAREMALKLIYDRKTARLLGAQAFGAEGVEKRIDVLATALHGKMTVHDLAELDLAYAPPFSSANDPVNVAAFVAENDLSGFSPLVTAQALEQELASATPPLLLDVRNLGEYERGHLAGAVHIPVDELRFELGSLPRDRRVVVYCRSGFRGHLAARVLRSHELSNVANLTGGFLAAQANGGFTVEGP